jgi:hydroxymethylpyrimidine pyrophosphatase-like HAD family hydrolase
MTQTDGWVLATDLDGTLLGGNAAERHRFYRWLEAPQTGCTLIFVTGRELENTLPLLDEPIAGEPRVPRPRYIIADIGTEIRDGHSLAPIAALQDLVVAAWGDANAQVEALLADEPGIAPQNVGARYRVSYFFDPDDHPQGPIDKIRDAGFDCLLSDGKYLDVLPSGISKGPTLLRLLEHCGLTDRPVVVAGDTLNDLSLFQTGLAGVAVGNSEAGLVEAVRDLPRVHLSRHPGVAGIWDGLHAHGLCGPPPAPLAVADPEPDPDDSISE